MLRSISLMIALMFVMVGGSTAFAHGHPACKKIKAECRKMSKKKADVKQCFEKTLAGEPGGASVDADTVSACKEHHMEKEKHHHKGHHESKEES